MCAQPAWMAYTDYLNRGARGGSGPVDAGSIDRQRMLDEEERKRREAVQQAELQRQSSERIAGVNALTQAASGGRGVPQELVNRLVPGQGGMAGGQQQPQLSQSAQNIMLRRSMGLGTEGADPYMLHGQTPMQREHIWRQAMEQPARDAALAQKNAQQLAINQQRAAQEAARAQQPATQIGSITVGGVLRPYYSEGTLTPEQAAAMAEQEMALRRHAAAIDQAYAGQGAPQPQGFDPGNERLYQQWNEIAARYGEDYADQVATQPMPSVGPRPARPAPTPGSYADRFQREYGVTPQVGGNQITQQSPVSPETLAAFRARRARAQGGANVQPAPADVAARQAMIRGQMLFPSGNPMPVPEQLTPDELQAQRQGQRFNQYRSQVEGRDRLNQELDALRNRTVQQMPELSAQDQAAIRAKYAGRVAERPMTAPQWTNILRYIDNMVRGAQGAIAPATINPIVPAAPIAVPRAGQTTAVPINATQTDILRYIDNTVRGVQGAIAPATINPIVPAAQQAPAPLPQAGGVPAPAPPTAPVADPGTAPQVAPAPWSQAGAQFAPPAGTPAQPAQGQQPAVPAVPGYTPPGQDVSFLHGLPQAYIDQMTKGLASTGGAGGGMGGSMGGGIPESADVAGRRNASEAAIESQRLRDRLLILEAEQRTAAGAPGLKTATEMAPGSKSQVTAAQTGWAKVRTPVYKTDQPGSPADAISPIGYTLTVTGVDFSSFSDNIKEAMDAFGAGLRGVATNPEGQKAYVNNVLASPQFAEFARAYRAKLWPSRTASGGSVHLTYQSTLDVAERQMKNELAVMLGQIVRQAKAMGLTPPADLANL